MSRVCVVGGRELARAKIARDYLFIILVFANFHDVGGGSDDDESDPNQMPFEKSLRLQQQPQRTHNAH